MTEFKSPITHLVNRAQNVEFVDILTIVMETLTQYLEGEALAQNIFKTSEDFLEHQNVAHYLLTDEWLFDKPIHSAEKLHRLSTDSKTLWLKQLMEIDTQLYRVQNLQELDHRLAEYRAAMSTYLEIQTGDIEMRIAQKLTQISRENNELLNDMHHRLGGYKMGDKQDGQAKILPFRPVKPK